MNKKLLVLLVGLTLAAVLLSCGITDLFKGKEEAEPRQQEEETVVPPAEEVVPPPEEPVAPPPAKEATEPAKPKPKEPAKPEEPAKEEEKVAKAGLGVIFVTNVRTGEFRVKIDNKLIIEHSFSGKKGGKAEELRFERELKFEPGNRNFKFVCEDNQGSKGVKELPLVFNPGQHKVVKISVIGAPGDMKLEILE